MDPLSALFMCFWFAYLLVRDGGPVLTEARGQVPHTANNRHAERMQRMQQSHEKWMARSRERQARFEQGHSTIGRALQNRVARWVDNAGRRVDVADEAIREAERRDAETGRTPGRWRSAWRNARMAAAMWWRNKAERAQERLSERFDQERPIADTPGPKVNVVTDDDPEPQSTPGAESQPHGDPAPEPSSPNGDQQQQERCAICGYERVSHAVGDGKYLCHNCWLKNYYWTGVGAAGSSANGTGQSAGKSYPPPPADDQSGAPKYYPSERADAPKALDAGPAADSQPVDDIEDAEVVDETPDPTPPAGGGEAQPSNGSINTGGPSMSEPVQTLTLNSGETINPETGIAFAEGLSSIYTEMGSRIQASIANLSQAGVAQEQIAKFTEMLNLNGAAQAKATEMVQHFTDHKGTAEHAAATGAGTSSGYLGNH